MKTKVITLAALCLLSFSFAVSAKVSDNKKKEKSEVSFLVSMKCEKCQKRIEDNLSFEKGVTGLSVSLPQKTVTVTYRKDKTSEAQLKSVINNLGYTATVLQNKNDSIIPKKKEIQ